MSFSQHTTLDILVLVLFSLVASALAIQGRSSGKFPVPPGPKPLPLLGNLFDLPKEAAWSTYLEWSRRWGDIVSINVLGQRIIILHSHAMARDLLEKRGSTYSDRPHIPFISMMGWEWFHPLARYGEQWRAGRKVLERGLRSSIASTYYPMQKAKARRLLARLLKSPEEFRSHVSLLQGEMIMSVTYGYDVRGHDDRFLSIVHEAADIGQNATLPGSLLVNELPILRFIPAWIPFISYWPRAHLANALGQEMINEPFQFVKKSMADGSARPSMAHASLREVESRSGSERELAEKTIKESLGSVYAAGSGTTVSSLATFFLAMTLHPEVQERAQKELDAVTGRSRLPDFGDRSQLPYIDAICREVSRWKPVVPSGVPHVCMEDDVYRGYFIPKGSIILANHQAILHDPANYADPQAFTPERFLDSDGRLRDDSILGTAFGFGRRVCPGRHFVDSALFIVFASVLATFDIMKAKDAESREIFVELAYTNAIVSHPLPFKCSITPRDSQARELIISQEVLER
ncbi:cytochrome P450 [Gloeopeniophorella convolvens]|nr:cytochrome P450 [Gloeopeniophorella convolvens]